MSKQPYMPLYVGDYIKDTRKLPLSVRGAWADLLVFMWDNDVRGEVTGTYEEFARLMSCTVNEATFALLLLMQKKICDFELLDNSEVKIISRRMKRDSKISKIRSDAGKTGIEVKFAKAKTQQNPDNDNEYNTVIKEVEFFEKARVSYPGTKRGLETEFENFQKKHRDWKEVSLILHEKILNQKSKRTHVAGMGGFVPEWKNFSTWINQRCWEEEIGKPKADEPKPQVKSVSSMEEYDKLFGG